MQRVKGECANKRRGKGERKIRKKKSLTISLSVTKAAENFPRDLRATLSVLPPSPFPFPTPHSHTESFPLPPPPLPSPAYPPHLRHCSCCLCVQLGSCDPPSKNSPQCLNEGPGERAAIASGHFEGREGEGEAGSGGAET